MDILKLSTDWARAEIFSSKFFILFGVLFIVAAIGFWQLGKTDLAKSYITPTLICGALLIIIGAGLVYANITRLSTFTDAFNASAPEFIQSELSRIDATIKEYGVVLKVIPSIVIAAALIVILIPSPMWRAIGITVIAMMSVILLVDGMAHARMVEYNDAFRSEVVKYQELEDKNN